MYVCVCVRAYHVPGSKVIESIGSALTKGGLKKGEKVLLNFVYPSAWIVSLPMSTGNGESGTVSAQVLAIVYSLEHVHNLTAYKFITGISKQLRQGRLSRRVCVAPRRWLHHRFSAQGIFSGFADSGESTCSSTSILAAPAFSVSLSSCLLRDIAGETSIVFLQTCPLYSM